MKFPLLICRRRTLFIGVKKFFERIGNIDDVGGLLDMNVTVEGQAFLRWIIDADGMLYDLTSMGVLPATLAQTLRLQRRRERYRIAPARQVQVGEIAHRIADLEDEFAEAPHVSDLQVQLSRLRPEQIVDRDVMKEFFGE